MAFPLSPIKQIELAASKIPGAISLAQGIPSFPLHAEIRSFVQEQIEKGLCDKYSLTTGLQELREEIAISLAAEGMAYDPDTEIICTVGSIQGIASTLLAITNPGDEVLILSPTYTSYQGVIAMARCVAKFAPLNEEDNFDLDLEAIERALTPKTRVIFYCNPNNPTGTIFSEAATKRLAELAEKHDLMILTDEVYKDFYFVDQPHVTPARYPESRGRVIRVFSFSKSFSMTGWRIGFVHSDRKIIEKILPYHDAMVTCAPVVSQYAAIAALRSGDRIIKEYSAEFRRRRDFVLSRLDRISDLVDYQIPTASYFVFPRIKQVVPKSNNSVALAYDILERAKVALVPGSAFGPSGESHLRLSFGREWSVLEEGLDRLENYFRATESSRSIAIKPLPEQPKKEKRGYIKSAAVQILGFSARKYLERNRSRVVGIVGAKGKTVFKRVLVDNLGRNVRGGILSYNTDIGFPLSVLNLSVASGIQGKCIALAKAVFRGLIGKEESETLILEYGVRSNEDAAHLLEIKVPDILILTELSEIYSSNLANAAELIASKVESKQIFWVESSVISDSLRKRLLPENRLQRVEGQPSESYGLAYSAVEKLSQVIR